MIFGRFVESHECGAGWRTLVVDPLGNVKLYTENQRSVVCLRSLLIKLLSALLGWPA